MHTGSDNRRPTRRLGRLLRDRRGVIAIVLGLVALPLIGIVGLAVDYGFATRAQALLNSAADSAAVAATDAAANAFVNNATSFTAPGVAAGTQVFTALAVSIPSVTVNPVTVTVTQTAGTATFVSVVNYTASYQTSFGVLFGVPAFPLAGGSTATISLRAFQDFHILMDTSGSMGIGATAADMATLAGLTLTASNDAYQNIAPYKGTYNGVNSFLGKGSGNCGGSCGAAQSTTQGCAFGCHWDTSNTNCGATRAGCDFYEIAKGANPGGVSVTLRQDVVQSAVQEVITTMATQDNLNQYRAAVYAFSTNYVTSGSTTTIQSDLTPISVLPPVGATAADLTAAATAAANMIQPIAGTDYASAPAGAPKFPEPNSNFGAAMTALAAGISCPGTGGTYIPCPGDGGTQSTPQEFLFVITDGMEDFCPSVSGTSTCNNRTIQPIQPSECAALKAQGVQILVLYVQYVPLDVAPYYNSFYVSNVQQYVDPNGTIPPTTPPYPSGTVPANLLACSSTNSQNPTGQLFIASNSAQIATQLQAMLQAAENQGVRLVR
jgi:Flp pilus assembly protein TadG